MAECPNCSSKLVPASSEQKHYGGISWYCPNCDSGWNKGDVYDDSDDSDSDYPSETGSIRLSGETDEDYRDRMEDLEYDEFN
ncbi:hypothetical protein OBK28_09325 [Empedobacter falsenii]